MRRLVREHELAPGDLIQPIFVVHGAGVEREIDSMPGVHHLSVDQSLDREVDRIEALGIPAVILFGLPAAKDEIGTENFAEDGIVQRALRRLRQRHPICC
jgi:porphobilinogen synthase